MVEISEMDDDVTLNVLKNLTPDSWKTLPLINKRFKDLFFDSVRRRVLSMKRRIIRVFGMHRFGDLSRFNIFYINTTRNSYRRHLKERYRAIKLIKSNSAIR